MAQTELKGTKPISESKTVQGAKITQWTAVISMVISVIGLAFPQIREFVLGWTPDHYDPLVVLAFAFLAQVIQFFSGGMSKVGRFEATQRLEGTKPKVYSLLE